MNVKIFAVAAVLIMAIGAVAVTSYNPSDSDADVSIIDGSNKKINLDKPLTNVAVLNSNVPKAMKMLGISDYISCYHYSKNLGIAAEKVSGAKLGTYYTPSVETLLEFGVQAVICPVSSMTLYKSAQEACENNGIKVIRLDCNGDSLFDDLQKLSLIFGEPDSAKEKLRIYSDNYEAVVDAVKAAVADKTKLDYLATVEMNASGNTGAIYTEKSALAKLYEDIMGANVVSYTDLKQDSVTTPADDGAKEVLAENANKIQTTIIRCTMTSDTSASDNLFNKYVGDSGIIGTDCPAYANNRIFVINSDLMSGIYGHIGLLLVAKLVYGIDVPGYEDINKVISDFQEQYEQDQIKDGAILSVSYGVDHGDKNGVVINYVQPAKA